MLKLVLLTLLLTAGAAVLSAADGFKPEDIIALERSALDRYAKADPQRYLELYAADITYFDPAIKKRIDGIEGMNALLVPLTGTFNVPRYELIDPKVQRSGDIAVLTFRLINYDAANKPTSRWNSTEVYCLRDGRWRIIHSHWSFTTPELK